MTIPIGALFHVTGSTAPSAPVRANVLERVTASMLALDDVHASSSVLPAGICLRVVVANTGANPERAVAEANRMVQDERVVGFVGPGTSDEAEAVSWLASAQRLPVVSASATAAGITTPSFFRTAPSDQHQGTAIIDLVQHLGASRIVLLFDNSTYGRGLAQSVAHAASRNVQVEIPTARAHRSAQLQTAVLNAFVAAGANHTHPRCAGTVSCEGLVALAEDLAHVDRETLVDAVVLISTVEAARAFVHLARPLASFRRRVLVLSESVAPSALGVIGAFGARFRAGSGAISAQVQAEWRNRTVAPPGLVATTTTATLSSVWEANGYKLDDGNGVPTPEFANSYDAMTLLATAVGAACARTYSSTHRNCSVTGPDVLAVMPTVQLAASSAATGRVVRGDSVGVAAAVYEAVNLQERNELVPGTRADRVIATWRASAIVSPVVRVGTTPQLPVVVLPGIASPITVSQGTLTPAFTSLNELQWLDAANQSRPELSVRLRSALVRRRSANVSVANGDARQTLNGMQRAVANLSRALVEFVPDAERVAGDPESLFLELEAYSRRAFDLIVVIGDDDTAAVAASQFASRFPHSTYLLLRPPFVAIPSPANLISVRFAEDEAAYLAGVVAAKVTEDRVRPRGPAVPPIWNGTVVILVDDEPDIRMRRAINGFATGVRHTCRSIGYICRSMIRNVRSARPLADADCVFNAAGDAGAIMMRQAAEMALWVLSASEDELSRTFAGGSGSGASRLLGTLRREVSPVIELVMREQHAARTATRVATRNRRALATPQMLNARHDEARILDEQFPDLAVALRRLDAISDLYALAITGENADVALDDRRFVRAPSRQLAIAASNSTAVQSRAFGLAAGVVDFRFSDACSNPASPCATVAQRLAPLVAAARAGLEAGSILTEVIGVSGQPWLTPEACPTGFAYVEDPSGDPERATCSFCPKGTYSLNGEPCELCPFGAVCEGGARIFARPNYWISDSGRVYECNPYSCCVKRRGEQDKLCPHPRNPSLTPAEAAQANLTRCNNLRTGLLCAECPKGLSLISEGSGCGICEGPDWTLLIATVSVAAVFVAYTLLRDHDARSATLTIAVDYMNFCMLVFSPSREFALEIQFGAASMELTAQPFTRRCFFPMSPLVKFISPSFLPLLLFMELGIIFVVVWCMRKLCRRAEMPIAMWRFELVLWAIVLLAYSALSRVGVEAIVYREVEGEKRIASAPGVKFGSIEYWFVTVIALVIAMATLVIVPVFIYINISRSIALLGLQSSMTSVFRANRVAKFATNMRQRFANMRAGRQMGKKQSAAISDPMPIADASLDPTVGTGPSKTLALMSSAGLASKRGIPDPLRESQRVAIDDDVQVSSSKPFWRAGSQESAGGVSSSASRRLELGSAQRVAVMPASLAASSPRIGRPDNLVGMSPSVGGGIKRVSDGAGTDTVTPSLVLHALSVDADGSSTRAGSTAVEVQGRMGSAGSSRAEQSVGFGGHSWAGSVEESVSPSVRSGRAVGLAAELAGVARVDEAEEDGSSSSDDESHGSGNEHEGSGSSDTGEPGEAETENVVVAARSPFSRGPPPPPRQGASGSSPSPPLRLAPSMPTMKPRPAAPPRDAAAKDAPREALGIADPGDAAAMRRANTFATARGEPAAQPDKAVASMFSASGKGVATTNAEVAARLIAASRTPRQAALAAAAEADPEEHETRGAESATGAAAGTRRPRGRRMSTQIRSKMDMRMKSVRVIGAQAANPLSEDLTKKAVIRMKDIPEEHRGLARLFLPYRPPYRSFMHAMLLSRRGLATVIFVALSQQSVIRQAVLFLYLIGWLVYQLRNNVFVDPRDNRFSTFALMVLVCVAGLELGFITQVEGPLFITWLQVVLMFFPFAYAMLDALDQVVDLLDERRILPARCSIDAEARDAFKAAGQGYRMYRLALMYEYTQEHMCPDQCQAHCRNRCDTLAVMYPAFNPSRWAQSFKNLMTCRCCCRRKNQDVEAARRVVASMNKSAEEAAAAAATSSSRGPSPRVEPRKVGPHPGAAPTKPSTGKSPASGPRERSRPAGPSASFRSVNQSSSTVKHPSKPSGKSSAR